MQDPVPEFIQILAPREELPRAPPLSPTRTKSCALSPPWPPKISFLQIFDQLFPDHKIFKKSVFSKASQNLKNRARGRPRPPFGVILDPPHPAWGARRVRLLLKSWLKSGLNCKRRASPPHPKALAISVTSIFVKVVGFCAWPIDCATLA